MATRTTILPSGTSHTELINLPLCGSWLGLVRVGIVAPVDATIHEWLFIWPNMPNKRTGYRRTALSTANNYYNSTLPKDQLTYRWLAQNESLMKITYTSTASLGVIYETFRDIRPAPFPDLAPSVWNISNSTPWTGANTTPGNATERPAGMTGQLNGVVYWKATT